MQRVLRYAILNLFLAMFLVACGGGGTESSQLSGKWIIKEAMGNPVPNDNNWMEFKPGGKLVQATTYSQTEGTWVLSGSTLTVTTNADPEDPDDFEVSMDYTVDSLEGDRMVLDLGGTKSVLKRQ